MQAYVRIVPGRVSTASQVTRVMNPSHSMLEVLNPCGFWRTPYRELSLLCWGPWFMDAR